MLGVLVLSALSLLGQEPFIQFVIDQTATISIKATAPAADTPITIKRGSHTQTVNVGTKATTISIGGTDPTVRIEGNLSSLTCSDLNISGLSASTQHPIGKLIANKHALKTFDASLFPSLTALSLSDGTLQELHIAKGSLLNNINLNNNQLRGLDLTNCPDLTRLQISGNGLDACTLNDIYATLPTLKTASSTANLINGKVETATPNQASKSETAIAEAKNWKVQIPGDASGCIRNTLTFDTPIRSEISLYLRLANSGAVSFQIDWGNGTVQDYNMTQEANGRLLEVKGTPTGNRVSLYGDFVRFEANNAEITNIETRYLKQLVYLGVRHNKIRTLDLSNNPNIKHLYLRDNQLTELNLQYTPLLEELYCRDNLLKSLDVQYVPHLKELAISRNPLASLDLKPLAELQKLYASGLKLQSIELKHHPQLYQLEINNNQISKLDISQNPEIGYINIEDNPISAAELNKLYFQLPRPARKVDWKNLLIGGEGSEASKSMTRIALAKGWSPNVEGDGSGAPIEQELILMKNYRGYNETIQLKLASTAVLDGAFKVEDGANGYATYRLYAPWIMLTGVMDEVSVANNQIQEIMIVKAETLKKLDASRNLITTLDLSHAPQLQELALYSNKIDKKEDLTAMIASLVTRTQDAPGKLTMVDTENSQDVQPCQSEHVQQALEKHWGIWDFYGGANQGAGRPYKGRDVHSQTIAADASTIATDAQALTISLTATEPMVFVTIYNTDGTLVVQAQADHQGACTLRLMERGVYIVQVGNRHHKVVL